MPIRDTLINELAEKYVIVMTGEETLSDAAENLYAFRDTDPGITKYNTFLVVAEAPDRYKAALFCELPKLLEALLPADLEAKPLAELPIPPATEVIPRNTPEPGGKVRERLKHSPGAVFIIVDDNGFVCLFANPERSGTPTPGAEEVFTVMLPRSASPSPTKTLKCTKGHQRVYVQFTGTNPCKLSPSCRGTVTW